MNTSSTNTCTGAVPASVVRSGSGSVVTKMGFPSAEASSSHPWLGTGSAPLSVVGSPLAAPRTVTGPRSGAGGASWGVAEGRSTPLARVHTVGSPSPAPPAAAMQASTLPAPSARTSAETEADSNSSAAVV